MAKLEIEGLPDDVTIIQGYFVWSGIESEGFRVNGGIEYPFQEEDTHNHDYDGMKTIGMLRVAQKMLEARELEGEED